MHVSEARPYPNTRAGSNIWAALGNQQAQGNNAAAKDLISSITVPKGRH